MKTKLAISSIILFLLISIATSVFAIDRDAIWYWSYDDHYPAKPVAVRRFIDIDGVTYKAECMDKGGKLNRTYSLDLEGWLDENGYEGLDSIEELIRNGETKEWLDYGWCKQCIKEDEWEKDWCDRWKEEGHRAWPNLKHFINEYGGWTKEVKFSGYKFSQQRKYLSYQDIAYAVTEVPGDSYEELDALQSIIWADKPGINIGSKRVEYFDENYPDLWEESQAYQEFYNQKKKNGGYKLSDDTNYEETKIIVNQSDGTYIAGPFLISAPGGYFTRSDGTIAPFAKITELTLVNDKNKTQNIVAVLDVDGNEMQQIDYEYNLDGQEFYLKFKKTANTNNVSLKVSYQYIDYCRAEMYQFNGKLYTASWKWSTDRAYYDDPDDYGCIHYKKNGNETKKATYGYYLNMPGTKSQTMLLIEANEAAHEKVWKTASIKGGTPLNITMNLGGTVFYDNTSGKPGTANGKYYSKDGDYGIENIEVTLYESNGRLATLAPYNGLYDEDEDRPRTNPTLTDSDGYYEFRGLDAQKKYYVVFKFNGQEYENTACNINKGSYNSSSWEITSKASIDRKDREELNERFEHIKSSPDNYDDVQTHITGFDLDENRTFTSSEAESAREDLYERIREYLENEEEYPDESAMEDIYEEMANDYGEDLVQFIVDTEVAARTGTDTSKQLFPIDSKFTLEIDDVYIGDKTYESIYDGQYYINLGLMDRERLDMNLKKDLYEATVTINNKTYTYQYNSRNGEQLTLDLRGTDVAPYGDNRNFYERQLRESDIQYIDYINNTPQKLRVYLTYKIRIYNSSNGDISTYVNSIYDYYDSDYTYLSSYMNPNDKAGTAVGWSQQGNSGNTLKKMITTDGKISNRELKSGSYEDIYVQYEVNTDAIKRLITEKESTKENYAEIGSYSSYYTNNKNYSNGKRIVDAGDPAGLIDIDSRPGNFNPNTTTVKNFVAYSYTQEYQKKSSAQKTKESNRVFEDDADKAPGFKLILSTERRQVSGNVWEDKNLDQLLKDQNIRAGDGINNDNTPIKQMKVELIDMDRGSSPDYQTTDIYGTNGFTRAVTYTDNNGNYSFSGYIPGTYTIKFTYGEGNTLTTTANGKVYNGQDYKSTLYEEEKHNAGDTKNNPNYWYTAANDKKSDAQDNLGIRDSNDQKTKTIHNYLANVLNYQVPQGQDPKNMLMDLHVNTCMGAYTSPLVMEVEYAKRTSGHKDKVEAYTIKDIDLGIIERPRSELTLTKDIKNIRIITTSGQTIFDATEQSPNLAWIKPQRNPAGTDIIGKVQATVEENLIYGSTIKILYEFTVENTGEKDYINSDGTINKKFYNTAVPDGQLARTNVTTILDYVANNLNFGQSLQEEIQYNSNWKVVTKAELQQNNKNSLVDDSINISSYRTYIINTETSPLTKALTPANKRGETGEQTKDTLLLTKVMQSADAETDDLTYDNSAEIVRVTNAVGRRSYNVRNKNQYTHDEIKDCVVSIPGNFNPKTLANLDEPDSDIAETVIVLPPFGENRSVYYIIGGVIIIAILGVGIYFIKKKVL